ncbi:hypothetical protein [Flavobacterium defluvii]|uniref:Uncharacterized protein n=1 Tax=Flavobacterium defluvii TaxID=370979 RepID=A0A1M5LN31_9FLAO|nr:hypothetical protein [Flavobacterium defluvii]SHG65743.1 hypothetical protein SAMN05443663_103400 [Flavobacterium defluvii]
MFTINIPSFTNDNYLYYQLMFTCILFLLLFFISGFSESFVIKYGSYVFAANIILRFLISFFTNQYWQFVLHWFLLSIAQFIFWAVLIIICGKYGKPHNGDGWIILLLPGYFLPLLIFISVLVKIIKIAISKF